MKKKGKQIKIPRSILPGVNDVIMDRSTCLKYRQQLRKVVEGEGQLSIYEQLCREIDLKEQEVKYLEAARDMWMNKAIKTKEDYENSN